MKKDVQVWVKYKDKRKLRSRIKNVFKPGIQYIDLKARYKNPIEIYFDGVNIFTDNDKKY